MFHEANRESYYYPTKCVARQYLHIPNNCGLQWSGCRKLPLETYYRDGAARFMTDTDNREAVKEAATVVDYLRTCGIPIKRIDTHSLQGGGANVLALAGYSSAQIMKMGWWKGPTFREYIREELPTYARWKLQDTKMMSEFIRGCHQ